MDVEVRAAFAGDWPGLWPLLVGMGVPAGQTEGDIRTRFERLRMDPT